MKNTSATEKRDKAVEYITEGVIVKIVYPDNIPEAIKQQKLNQMYDIFSGAMCRSSDKKVAE